MGAIKKLSNSRNEKGQTLVEYLWILAFISAVAIAVRFGIGTQGNDETDPKPIVKQQADATASH